MSSPRHVKKVYQKNSPKKWVGRIFFFGLFSLLFFFIATASAFLYYAKDLPRPERLSEISFARPTKIYDKTGEVLLYEMFGEEKREILKLEEIPPILQHAILATEDANFYHHFGLDWRGVARAVLTNVRLRSPQQGGSTISQQLTRSALLTREKTIERKVKELVLTLELERRYSKDQILEFYLNQVPLGSTVYGVGAATQFYFAKAPKDVTLAEAATIAALIQAPSRYSPYGANKASLLARKDYVLDRMMQEGYIDTEKARETKQQEVVFATPSLSLKAPHFILYVIDQLLEKYTEDFLRENGLRVTTTLDWELQQAAERAVATYAERNMSFAAHNAGLVATHPATGAVVAMVGSKDWFKDPYPAGCVSGRDCLFDPKVNVVVLPQGRQPGSAFKPFVYATAFTKGHTDATQTLDEQTNFGVWGGKEYIPQNFDGKFHGQVTLRQALAQSLNIPSIKVLLDMAGLQDSIDMAREMGITTLKKNASAYGPSIVLGGGEARLLDMVSAYGVFATEGKRIPPVSIARVEDAEGNMLQKNGNTSITILPAEATRMITSILSDNEARTPVFGPNSPLYFPDYQVAAKTGTTQDFRDGWVVGYTKDIVTGVWVGNNDNSSMNKEPGVVVGGPIWHDFMASALPRVTTP